MNTNKIPGVIVIDGHVQGLSLTRSLGELGIPVYVVDRNKFAISKYSKYCQKFFISPDYLDDVFPDFLISLAESENLQNWLLLPCDDHIVYSISKRKKDLSEVFKVITVDFDILKSIINKEVLNRVAELCNIPVIKTYYPKSRELVKTEFGFLRYPLLIKGTEGQSFYKNTKSKAFEVKDFEELQVTYSSLVKYLTPSDIMIQEKIPLSKENKVVSFTAFCVGGEIKAHWMGEKLREHPIYFGTATYTESVNVAALLDQSIPLIKKLSYTGVCEIEYLLDPRDGNYYLIEINPRTWLWVGLAKKCGVNYPEMIYNYVHEKSQEYPKQYKEKVRWMNLWTDTFFSLKYILQGKLSLASYIKSIFKKKTFAIFSLRDFLPFISMGLLLFYINKRR